MLYRKFVRKKTQLSDVLSEFVIFLKLVSCGESWKSLFPIILIFHRTDFGGFLVCYLIAIQQLNGVENGSVAISLILNHNLTGLQVLPDKMQIPYIFFHTSRSSRQPLTTLLHLRGNKISAILNAKWYSNQHLSLEHYVSAGVSLGIFCLKALVEHIEGRYNISALAPISRAQGATGC